MVAASYLVENKNLPPEFREDVTAIWRNVQLEAQLIDDLLDVTRITRGKIEIHHKVVDVHSCLKNTVQIAQKDILEKQIELVIDLEIGRASCRERVSILRVDVAGETKE